MSFVKVYQRNKRTLRKTSYRDRHDMVLINTFQGATRALFIVRTHRLHHCEPASLYKHRGQRGFVHTTCMKAVHNRPKQCHRYTTRVTRYENLNKQSSHLLSLVFVQSFLTAGTEPHTKHTSDKKSSHSRDVYTRTLQALLSYRLQAHTYTHHSPRNFSLTFRPLRANPNPRLFKQSTRRRPC